jgi:dihydrofolate reductase
MLPIADTLYLTQIHQEFPGDTFFLRLMPRNGSKWSEKMFTTTRRLGLAIASLNWQDNNNLNL